MTDNNFLGYKKGSLPQTDNAAMEIFSLFLYTSLSNHEQMTVIEGLRAISKEIIIR